MKIYLSGGLNGYSLEERKKVFQDYEDRYSAEGFEVINPLTIDDGEHGTVDGTGTLRPTEEQWREFMARDLAIILRDGIDRLYLLPGWNSSRGAKLESLVALYLDIPQYDAETGERLI